jgi:hypothetical protein
MSRKTKGGQGSGGRLCGEPQSRDSELREQIFGFRKKCLQVEITLGGDGGFCRKALMSWTEEHAVGYVFGSPRING